MIRFLSLIGLFFSLGLVVGCDFKSSGKTTLKGGSPASEVQYKDTAFPAPGK